MIRHEMDNFLIRYAVDLISAIADHLKFNFTFKWVDDGNYGSKKEDSNEWNGMIGELMSGVRKIFLLEIFDVCTGDFENLRLDYKLLLHLIFWAVGFVTKNLIYISTDAI